MNIQQLQNEVKEKLVVMEAKFEELKKKIKGLSQLGNTDAEFLVGDTDNDLKIYVTRMNDLLLNPEDKKCKSAVYFFTQPSQCITIDAINNTYISVQYIAGEM